MTTPETNIPEARVFHCEITEYSQDQIEKLARYHVRIGKCLEATLELAMNDPSLWGELESPRRARTILMILMGFEEEAPSLHKQHVLRIPEDLKPSILAILNPKTPNAAPNPFAAFSSDPMDPDYRANEKDSFPLTKFSARPLAAGPSVYPPDHHDTGTA